MGKISISYEIFDEMLEYFSKIDKLDTDLCKLGVEFDNIDLCIGAPMRLLNEACGLPSDCDLISFYCWECDFGNKPTDIRDTFDKLFRLGSNFDLWFYINTLHGVDFYYSDMIYKSKREEQLLAEGIYKCIPYCVISYGTHPCAYIDLGRTRFDGADYWNDIYLPINVHGGFTYCETEVFNYKNGWFLGWDYLHSGDYNGLESFLIQEGARKWTTEEIVAECKSVIDQLEKVE